MDAVMNSIHIGSAASAPCSRVPSDFFFSSLPTPGSLAGTVGSLGAVALTWGVSRYALEIPWRIFAGEHIGGVAITAVLVAVIGVVSSLDVLRHKQLATLRAE